MATIATENRHSLATTTIKCSLAVLFFTGGAMLPSAVTDWVEKGN